jgi:hypothetical protein
MRSVRRLSSEDKFSGPSLSFAIQFVHTCAGSISQGLGGEDSSLRRTSTGSSVAFLLIWMVAGGRDMLRGAPEQLQERLRVGETGWFD